MDLQSILHGDLEKLIQAIGLLGVFGIVFAESGLLIGFFLPGDSLLFTAGLLAAQGFFPIPLLVIGCFIAAVLGDSVGYYMGHKYGRKLFNREESILFHKDHLIKAEAFYKKHGGKTIVLARFMPVIRTFAPIVAGMGSMNYATFLIYNLFGGFLWAVGLTLLGYYLGNIPFVQHYFEYFIFGIIFLSIAPVVYHIFKDPSSRASILKLLRLK